MTGKPAPIRKRPVPRQPSSPLFRARISHTLAIERLVTLAEGIHAPRAYSCMEAMCSNLEERLS